MTSKQAWEPMRLTEVGTIAEVVQGGGGKLSIIAADVGDVRKPKGQGSVEEAPVPGGFHPLAVVGTCCRCSEFLSWTSGPPPG